MLGRARLRMFAMAGTAIGEFLGCSCREKLSIAEHWLALNGRFQYWCASSQCMYGTLIIAVTHGIEKSLLVSMAMVLGLR